MKELARVILAKLIPHTTSVHNVDVIEKALLECRNNALEEAEMLCIGTGCIMDKTTADTIREQISNLKPKQEKPE